MHGHRTPTRGRGKERARERSSEVEEVDRLPRVSVATSPNADPEVLRAILIQNLQRMSGEQLRAYCATVDLRPLRTAAQSQKPPSSSSYSTESEQPHPKPRAVPFNMFASRGARGDPDPTREEAAPSGSRGAAGPGRDRPPRESRRPSEETRAEMEREIKEARDAAMATLAASELPALLAATALPPTRPRRSHSSSSDSAESMRRPRHTASPPRPTSHHRSGHRDRDRDRNRDQREVPPTDLRDALTAMATGLGAVVSALGSSNALQGANAVGSNADPHFDEWDGNEYSLPIWIRNATQAVQLRGTSDKAAIQFARLKLAKHLADEFPEDPSLQPRTWPNFVKWLKENFYPQKWGFQSRLRLIRGGVQMKDGSNLRSYVNKFQAAVRDFEPPLDDLTKQVFFMQGLTSRPYMQYMILHGWKGGTFEDLKKRAYEVHTDVVHPALMNLTRPVAPGTITAQMDYSAPPALPPPPKAPPATTSTGTMPMELDAMRVLLAKHGIEAPPTSVFTAEPPMLTGQSMLKGGGEPSDDPPPRNSPKKYRDERSTRFRDQGRDYEPKERYRDYDPKGRYRDYGSRDYGREHHRPPRRQEEPQRPRGRDYDSDRSLREQRYPRRERDTYRRQTGYSSRDSGNESSRYSNSSRDDRPYEKNKGRKSYESSGSDRALRCYNCDERGHKARDCPHQRRASSQSSREGARESWRRSDRDQDRPRDRDRGYARRSDASRDSPKSHSTYRKPTEGGGPARKPLICYNCNEEGHIASKCPRKGGREANYPKGAPKRDSSRSGSDREREPPKDVGKGSGKR